MSVLPPKVADVPQVNLAKSMISYKSREQRQLECLERIEGLLQHLVNLMDAKEPVGHVTTLETVDRY
jgi:hypothetical protein